MHDICFVFASAAAFYGRLCLFHVYLFFINNTMLPFLLFFFVRRARTQMGRLDEARTIFSQGIEAAGMAGEALHFLLCSRADVLHRLKRSEECIEDCTRAIRCRTTHCTSAAFQSRALNWSRISCIIRFMITAKTKT